MNQGAGAPTEASPLFQKDKSQPILLETESVCDSMDGDPDSDADEAEAHRWREEVRQAHQHFGFLQRPSKGLLCLLLVIISLGEMICLTPMISLTMEKVCAEQSKGGEPCDPIKVQETVSSIYSGSMILGSLVGLALSGTWGQLSDQLGRVKVFTYTTLIRLIGTCLQVFTLSSWCPFSPTAIVLAYAFSNLSGGTVSLLANCYSYISDITEPEERTESMGSVMSACYATMGFGPMVSSVLLDLPFGSDTMTLLISIAILMLSLLLCIFGLQEPRHEQARRNSCQSAQEGKVSVLDPLKQLWIPRTRKGSVRPRYTVILLLTLDVLFLCITAAVGSALLLYFSYRYSWGSRQMGYFLSFTGLGKAAVLLMVAPSALQLLRNRYGTLSRTADRVDILCIRVSIFSLLIGLALIYWRSDDPHMAYVYAILQAPSALCSPTIQSTIIKYCPKSATGQCFGGIALIRSAVMLIFPALLLRVYGRLVATKPEAFILVPLSCALLGVLLSFLLIENPMSNSSEREQSSRRRDSWLSLPPSERAREETIVQAETLRENYSRI